MASLTKNPNVNAWVDEMIALTKPDNVVWIDGSDEQIRLFVTKLFLQVK